MFAALAPIPISMDFDNQATLTTANATHDQTIDLHIWLWARRRNRDIWSAYHKIAQARGHQSITTKVKAHPHDKTTPPAYERSFAEGTDTADAIAKGARQYHDGLLKQYLSLT